MPYTPTQWKDRVVERPRTYTIQENPDGTVTLIPVTGTIYEPGTPVSAANLNKIEQGIADAHNAVAGRLAHCTVTSGTYDFNNRATGSFLEEIKNNGGITIQNGPSGFSNGCLIQTEGAHSRWLQQLLMDSSGKIWFRRSFDSGSTTVWESWEELYHTGNLPDFVKKDGSVGMTGTLLTTGVNVSTNGDAVLWIESTDPATTTYRRKAILSSPNVGGGNDWLFRQLRPSDGAVEDFFLRGGQAGDIWTTARLRTTNGVLEFWDGGTWKPVGNIQVGRDRSLTVNVTTSNGYPSAGVWYTLLNTNTPGRLHKLTFQCQFTGTMQLRVTMDGASEIIGSPSGSGTFLDASTGEATAPIYFSTNLKIEANVTDPADAAANTVSVLYALKMGTT